MDWQIRLAFRAVMFVTYIFFSVFVECFGALEMSNEETKNSHKFRESIKYNGNEEQKRVMCISAVIRYISHQTFSIGF